MLSCCFLDFSVGVRASVIGLSQISSFSLMTLRHYAFSRQHRTQFSEELLLLIWSVPDHT